MKHLLSIKHFRKYFVNLCYKQFSPDVLNFTCVCMRKKRRTSRNGSIILLEVQMFWGEPITVKVYSSSTSLNGKNLPEIALPSSHRIVLTDFDNPGDGATSQLVWYFCAHKNKTPFFLVAAAKQGGTQLVSGPQAGFQPPNTC